MKNEGCWILPPDGRGLLPAIEGLPATGRTLVVEHEGNAALVEGD